MRERTSLDELELQGSPNLRRAQKREEAERNAAPLSPEAESEIGKLNVLIAQAMSACKRGQIFRGKPNPAFGNLAKLIRARDTLLRGHKPVAKTAKQILSEANALLTGVN